MPITEMIVSIAVAGALVLGFIAVLSLFAARIRHTTIRKAIDTNPELAAGMLDKLTARKERSGDDRLALVLIAIGVAMAVAPVIAVDDPGIVRFAIAASLFPLLVGGALWLRYRAVERARRSDPGE